MPTSAPGKTEAGLTLVELLVVLLIIGMTAGIAVLAVPRGQSDLAKAADQVERDVAAMRDQAVAQGAYFGLRPEPFGYVRLRGVDGEWKTVDRRVLPDGVTLELAAEEGWRLPEHEGEIPLGLPAPREDENEDGLTPPEVVFAPEGSVTPFAVRLRAGRSEAVLDVGPFGRIREPEDA